MTDDELVADALGSYNLAVKAIGERVRETGVIPECLLGDGEHSRRLIAEQENRTLRKLVGDALAVYVPHLPGSTLWRLRARRALAKEDSPDA